MKSFLSFWWRHSLKAITQWATVGAITIVSFLGFIILHSRFYAWVYTRFEDHWIAGLTTWTVWVVLFVTVVYFSNLLIDWFRYKGKRDK